MNYIIFNDLPENIESPVERLIGIYWQFKNNGEEVRVVTNLHQLSLHQFIDRYNMDGNDFINLFDYFQEATAHVGEPIWYSDVKAPTNFEIFGSYHHATLQDGSIERARMTYQPEPTPVDRFVMNVSYHNRDGKTSIIDRWDWRGFKSATAFYDNDKAYFETFYTPTGKEAFSIEYAYSDEGPYISGVRRYINKDQSELYAGVVSMHQEFLNDLLKDDHDPKFFFSDTQGRAGDPFVFVPEAEKYVIVNYDFRPNLTGAPTQLVSNMTEDQRNQIKEFWVDNEWTRQSVEKSMPEIADRLKVVHGAPVSIDQFSEDKRSTLKEKFKNDDMSIVLLVHGAEKDDENFKIVYDRIKALREQGTKVNVRVIRKWMEGDNLKAAIEEKNDWFERTYNDLTHETEAQEIIRTASDAKFVIDLSDDQGAAATTSASLNAGMPVIFFGENGLASTTLDGSNGIVTQNFDDVLAKIEEYLTNAQSLSEAQQAAKATQIH